ncbi:hypothetical protein RhiJN_13411 [Ceratobasidium sp. AG-Ba]|nr:hypothetical protein RhiJN_13411 [Ceratobasidium sp. AG-Ba]
MTAQRLDNEVQQLGDDWDGDVSSQKQEATLDSGALLPPSKRARKEKYHNYVPEEETIRNDYSQRYVDGGEWPQNWVLGAKLEQRFEEYPKQRRLLELKRTSVASVAHPPTYLPCSSLSTLVDMQVKFDVILLDPPVSESAEADGKDYFSWADVQAMPIPALAAEPSFIFMWVGSGAGDGLERGREVLARWGFRRCEDVVWVKTNTEDNKGPGADPPTTSLLVRTKQHCLMGIKGTVRRSTDSWFVHCNIDTDVIIWDGDPTDPTRKPPEMYSLIENFCLGTRRLEIFGKLSSLRKGWVTALSANAGTPTALKGETSPDTPVPWDKTTWDTSVHRENGKCVVPSSPEIEILRPKSPQRGPPNSMPNMPNAVKPPFQQPFAQQPSPHPQTPTPNNMMGKPLHMGFQRHPNMGPRPGLGPNQDPNSMAGQMANMGMGMPMGMGGPMGMNGPMGMGMGMNMNMNMGGMGMNMPNMRMNEFGFVGPTGPGGMGMGMAVGPQNGMMPNGPMFGMAPGGMNGQMMFNPGGFDGGGNMNMGFDQSGPGPQSWMDSTGSGGGGGWQQRPDGMGGQHMGMFMNNMNMMGNTQLPPGFDGNRGF